MSCCFVKGDFVTGNSESDKYYGVTTDKATMKVIEVLKNDYYDQSKRLCDMIVEIVWHESWHTGRRYSVYSKYFVKTTEEEAVSRIV